MLDFRVMLSSDSPNWETRVHAILTRRSYQNSFHRELLHDKQAGYFVPIFAHMVL